MNPLLLLPFVSMAKADEVYEPNMISVMVMDKALTGGEYEEVRNTRIYTVNQYSQQNLQYLNWFKIPVYLDEIVFFDKDKNGLSKGDKIIYNFRFKVGGRNMFFSFEDEFHNSEGLYATCVYTDLQNSNCISVADFSKYNENPTLIYQTTGLYRNKVGSLLDSLSP
ncbi:MAG: hypothetical protein ISS01_02505 [Nanoarchaeota archaeon]|nr:hypothetical protein [Nanoarchaeota archaeon]